MPKQAGAIEVTSGRREDSRVWYNPNGTRTAEFGRDFNYPTGGGDYEPVDLNFRQVSTTEWISERSRHRVRAYREAGLNWIEITQRASGKGIRYQIPLSAVVVDDYVEFTGFGLTWRYYLTKRGVKLESSAVAASLGPKTYNFTVELVGGATLAQVANATGGLDGDSFLIPRANAHCADGVIRPLSAWSRSGNIATFAMDDSAYPAAAYPYTVDPSTTISVAADADDQFITRSANAYPPSAGTLQRNRSGVTQIEVTEQVSGPTFFMDEGLVRWDTSGLPDNGTVVGGTIRVVTTFATSNGDVRNLVGEYYAWDGVSDSDWSATAPGSPIFSAALSTLPAAAGVQVDIPLTDVSGISPTGNTSVRFMIDGGQPAGANAFRFAANEHATSTEPQLIVDYQVGDRIVPTGVSGLTNLTGAFTDIDQDPDGTITDAGLVTPPPGVPITHRSSTPAIGTTETSTISTTVTIPSDVVNNDIMVLTVTNGDATAQPTVSDNSGVGSWTVLQNSPGTLVGVSVWWKRVTNQATERAKVVTASGITGSACSGLSTYTDCELTGSPSDATPVAESNAAAANTSAGITTVTDGALVGFSHGYTDDSPAITAGSVVATDPASFVDRIRHISSGGSDSQVGHHSAIKATAGATGNVTWSGTSDAGASIVFALKPEVPPTTVNTQADVAMGDPTGTLVTGAGTGEIRARFRKKGTGSDPTGRLELRNAAGTLLDTPIPNATIATTAASGQLVSGLFDQANVTSATDVVFRFVGTGASGGAAELVAVEWVAQTAAAAAASEVIIPQGMAYTFY